MTHQIKSVQGPGDTALKGNATSVRDGLVFLPEGIIHTQVLYSLNDQDGSNRFKSQQKQNASKNAAIKTQCKRNNHSRSSNPIAVPSHAIFIQRRLVIINSGLTIRPYHQVSPESDFFSPHKNHSIQFP
jgi:hypothetical protein